MVGGKHARGKELECLILLEIITIRPARQETKPEHASLRRVAAKVTGQKTSLAIAAYNRTLSNQHKPAQYHPLATE